MSLYSDFAPRRSAQIVADIAAVAVSIVAIVLGVAVYQAIAVLGAVWAQLEDAGTGFQGTMGEIGESLGGVPLIGSGIRGPFDTAAGAGESIAEAGRAGQEAVNTIAVLAGVGVAVLPIAIVLLVWLWPRIRFVRRAADIRALLRLEDGERLLALRALDDASAAEIARVSPRALTAWREGDAGVIRGLAAIETARAGVRLPGAAAASR